MKIAAPKALLDGAARVEDDHHPAGRHVPSFGSIRSFRSVTGGASWRVSVQVSGVIDHPGKVFVAWQDCRFRFNCSSNDLVMSTATPASYPTWSAVTRIPIDGTASTVDHFIPGLAVDRGTSGATLHLGLAYYFDPNAGCSFSTCQLDVGYVFSHNGGSTWSAPTQLTGQMSLSWLASTSLGRMVGDYISSSFANGGVRPVIAVASAPSGGLFDEAMFTTGALLP
ncbi:MAG: sialidase family protein [Gaiellaceae bacterium]